MTKKNIGIKALEKTEYLAEYRKAVRLEGVYRKLMAKGEKDKAEKLKAEILQLLDTAIRKLTLLVADMKQARDMMISTAKDMNKIDMEVKLEGETLLTDIETLLANAKTMHETMTTNGE